MKAISSAAAAVIIATISISLVGSYFLSKRIMEGPTEVGRLGIGILQTQWQESSCTLSDSTCSCASVPRCRGDSDCYPENGGDATCTADCPPRDHTTVVNNCNAYYNHDCHCPKNKCAGSCTCLVDGSCNYICDPYWYNDDEIDSNGCENAPPKYSNPIGSGPQNPNPGDAVYHWVNWEDINGASLDTAILEVNGSGGNCDQTVNVSFYGLSGTSELANISWQVGSNCGGKVIAWRQYTNDTVNRWNVSSIQTYTVFIPVIDLSFNLKLPGIDPIESSGTKPGTATTPLEFNATSKTDYNVVPCVYGYGCSSGYIQDAMIPIFNFTNTGTTAEKWNISLSQALPPYIHLYGDTDNSRAGATEITTSGWIAVENVPVGEYREVWLWVDFVDALPGAVDIAINHTSMSTT